MKIFLDTADTQEIIRAQILGLIDGVTTNPTLIRKSGNDPIDVYSAIADLGIPDISMEVYGGLDEMHTEALKLSERFGDVATIKLPMTKEGLIVCQDLSKRKIRTNVTLIFSIPQAILAAKSGATYVSPFVGRLDDQQVAGLEVVRGISGLYQMKGVNTQVLAASIRSVQRAVRSFYNGADIVTMPFSVFSQMYDHILTDKGLDIFDKDIAALNKEN
jgi:transaldolase|tara:strand:+ start:1048 stop:1698 length:651 start_codon:yes stop_codon:yes gene_type:complete